MISDLGLEHPQAAITTVTLEHEDARILDAHLHPLGLPIEKLKINPPWNQAFDCDEPSRLHANPMSQATRRPAQAQGDIKVAIDPIVATGSTSEEPDTVDVLVCVSPAAEL